MGGQVSRGAIRDGGTIAQRPHAGPVGDLHILVYHQTAALLLAFETLQERIGRGTGRPDQGIGLNHRAVTQLNPTIRNPCHFVLTRISTPRHGIHHRGQLSLMCRLAGGPGLYGPNREKTAAMRATVTVE